MPPWLREETYSSSSVDPTGESQPLLNADQVTVGTLRQRKYFVLPSARPRKRTDVLFLVLFILFWLGMLILGVFSFKGKAVQGSWKYITSGVDYAGRKCTFSNAIHLPSTSNHSSDAFAYYPDIHNNPDFSICVNECPKEAGKVFQVSLPIINENIIDAVAVVVEFETYATVKQTYACAPNNSKDSIQGPQLTDTLGRFIGALSKSWIGLLAAAGAAIATAALYALGLRYFGGCLVPFSMVVMQVGLIVGGYEMLMDSDSITFQHDPAMKTSLEVTCIVLFILAALFFLLSIYLIRRVWLTWSFVQYATRAISQLGSQAAYVLSLAVPLIQSGLLVLIALWGVSVSVCLFSAGQTSRVVEYIHSSNNTIVPVPVLTFETNTHLRWMIFYHLFGVYWAIQFVLTIGSMIVSLVTAIWYFEPEAFAPSEQTSSDHPVKVAISTVFRFHLGTCALAAAIVAPVQIVRGLLLWIDQKSRQPTENTNQRDILKFISKCCCCCLWCLNRGLKYISYESIAVTAIHGTPFFLSARLAHSLSQANLLRVGALDRIGQTAVFLGKLFVCLVSILLCSQLLPATASSPVLPMVVTALFAYAIAQTFLALYELTINTLFLCFLIDEDMHGGQGQAAFAPYPYTKLIDDNLRPKWQTVL